MRKILLVLLCLFIASIAYADTDTIEGTATSTTDTYEGTADTVTDKFEGQTVAGGGDGAIGRTTHAGTPISMSNTFLDYHDAADIQATTGGTVRYAHVWVEDSNGLNICVSLNLSSDGTVKLTGSGTRADDSAGWVNIDCGSDYTLLSATDYILATSAPDGTISAGSDGIASVSGFTNGCGNTKSSDNTGIASNAPLTILFNNSSGDPS